MKINEFLSEFLPGLLFTSRCRFCNRLIRQGEKLCDECAAHIPLIEGERCGYCGAGKDRCDCKKKKNGYDGITSPFYYEDAVRSCISRFKFNGKMFLAEILTDYMAQQVKKDFDGIDFDFICFVPFTPVQSFLRSYNQSEILAEKLAEKLNIPFKAALVKLFETSAQHEMLSGNRKGNVFGVYDVKNRTDVRDKTILLVDDVKTTGSTLDECAWILKIRGAKSVYCVTAALAGLRSKKEKL
mgnify:CR=1 FL=1